MTHYQIRCALLKLRPGAVWTLYGNDLSKLEWLDLDQDRPTDAEIEAEAVKHPEEL